MLPSNVIYTLLAADSAVTDLVGDRIEPEDIPGDLSELPYIAYTADELDIQMNSHGQGPGNQLITVGCFGATQNDARSLANAVLAVITPPTAPIKNQVIAGVNVMAILMKGSSNHTYTIGNMGQDAKVYATEVQFLVWFKP